MYSQRHFSIAPFSSFPLARWSFMHHRSRSQTLQLPEFLQKQLFYRVCLPFKRDRRSPGFPTIRSPCQLFTYGVVRGGVLAEICRKISAKFLQILCRISALFPAAKDNEFS